MFLRCSAGLLAAGILVLLPADHAEQESRRLDRYEMVTGPIVVDGVGADVSGLAYSPDTGTLFGANNNPAILFEITTGGDVLRTLKVTENNDTEGVEVLPGSRLVVTEERLRNLLLFQIPQERSATQLHRDEAGVLRIVEAPPDNIGLEGVTYNPRENCFYVAKERDPCMIYKVQLAGSSQLLDDAEISELFELDNVETANGLHFDAVTGNLLVISSRNKCVVEMTLEGQELSRLSDIPLPQPEGVAMDGEGTLYVVSEPNLLCVFKRP